MCGDAVNFQGADGVVRPGVKMADGSWTSPLNPNLADMQKAGGYAPWAANAKSLLHAAPKPEPGSMAKPAYADMGRTGQGGGPRSLLGAA